MDSKLVKAKEIEAARKFLMNGPSSVEEDMYRGRAKHIDPHPQIPIIGGTKGIRLLKSMGKYKATNTENTFLVIQFSKRLFAVDIAVGSFYLLQGMMVKFTAKPPETSKEKALFNDVSAHLKHTITETAGAIHDYMCLACWGEARHSWRAAELVHPLIPLSPTRSAVAAESTFYDPAEFKPVIEKLYKFGKWGGGAFGGWNWGKIAEIANMYGKVDDVIFIDFSVGLSHNGGLQFSKPFLVRYSAGVGTLNYRYLLDAKRDKNLVDYTGITSGGEYGSLPIGVDITTKTLLDRGRILTLWPSSKYFKPIGDLKRQEVKWGTAHFPQLLIHVDTPNRKLCEHCARPTMFCNLKVPHPDDKPTTVEDEKLDTAATNLYAAYMDANNTDNAIFTSALGSYVKIPKATKAAKK